MDGCAACALTGKRTSRRFEDRQINIRGGTLDVEMGFDILRNFDRRRIFGFSGVAAASARIAKVLFFVAAIAIVVVVIAFMVGQAVF